MRVLHLIDPGSPGGGACSLRLLAEPMRRLTSVFQQALVIGHAGHERLARRCGVPVIGHLCPPRSLPWAGTDALRTLVQHAFMRREGYDILHAWTPRAALLAAHAAPALPVLGLFHAGPADRSQMRLLRRKARGAHVRLAAGTSAVHREFRSLGFDGRRISLLPPAVNPHPGEMAPRDQVRDRWIRERSIRPDTFVVGLLCEPVTWPDLRLAAGAAARLRLSGRDVRLVAHHDAARRLETLHYLRGIGMEDLLLTDDRIAEPWEIVQGLDAALLIGRPESHGGGAHRHPGLIEAVIGADVDSIDPAPSVLPLLWAFAAGLPVVAEDTDAVRGVVEDGVTGLLIGRHDVNAAADRLARMFDDRTIAGRLGAAAAHAANDLFHISAYCVRLKHMYELLTAHRRVAQAADFRTGGIQGPGFSPEAAGFAEEADDSRSRAAGRGSA